MRTILYAILVLGVLGGVFGALLALASEIFHFESDPQEDAIKECLGGINCGGCGYPSCSSYAKAVASGKEHTNKCVVLGAEGAKKIAHIMGVSAEKAVEKFAFVKCSGCEGIAEKRFHYTGPQDCRAAMLFGGKDSKLCTFACIGLGNCTRVCTFDAIHIVNGIAQVDRANCVGCGKCAEACPKNIIEILNRTQAVAPACSSKDKGAKVNKICSAGCIGCMRCQKECPTGAITVTDNLAKIDASKCTACGRCVEICPRKIIQKL